MSVYDPSGAFEVATRPGFETVVLSIPAEHLAAVGECVGLAPPCDVLPQSEVAVCQPEQMRALHELLSRVIDATLEDPTDP